jgi:cytochrome c553
MKLARKFGFIMCAASVAVAASASADPKADLLNAERKAWDDAKPVFDRACAACHTTNGKKASKKK